MDLFKRVLLSLFPDNIVNQPVNPATMFISFVNPKQFFSVINRKIVENYKLNLFDVALDSFEVKIGFGDQPSIKLKDIDFYYSYGVVANFNGYRFLSPSNLGNIIAIVSSLYFRKSFDNPKYYLNFLITIYLLTFLFQSRLKVFPEDEKVAYRWFIDVVFEFYHIVLEQSGEIINADEFKELRSTLLKNLEVFFMLFYFYKRLNTIFYTDETMEREFYSWIFYDELKKGNYKYIVTDFIDNFKLYTKSSSFTLTEKKIINLIFPADVLIRYLFDPEDIYFVVDYMIDEIYDKNKLDELINSFLKNDDKLEEFIYYIMNYNLFKDNYFKGLKKLIVNKFSDYKTYSEQQDFEEIISLIGSPDNIENFKVPERIKKESNIMERLINFYITFTGGFWNSKGDNFHIRLFRKPIIDNIVKSQDIVGMKQDVLFFYGGLLYLYSKNVFYYKYAFENVREGKEKFNLPFKSTFKEVYSNMYILKLFNENFIATLLQDINVKDIKIYLQNKEILNLFKVILGENISHMVRLSKEQIIDNIYGDISSMLYDTKDFLGQLNSELKESDVSNLKESIYTLDFWMWKDFVMLSNKFGVNFSFKYSDITIIGIVSIVRDSLLGFLLYYKYMKDEQNKLGVDIKLDLFKTIYIEDILGLSGYYTEIVGEIINSIFGKYESLLEKWIEIDSNNRYFGLGIDNWLLFIDNKDEEKIISDLGGEDLIWLRGYLKNITFYNKRYLIPKD